MKTELSRLFDRWRDAQKEESADSYEQTRPQLDTDDPSVYERIKASFVADGCVDYEKYFNSEKRVLFILKEAAIFRNGNTDPYSEDTANQIDTHWFKTVMENGGSLDPKYYNRFISVLSVLGTDRCAAALMNINKRGGLAARTGDKRLSAYIDRYKKDYIMKEIEILRPTTIISCIGTGYAAENLFSLKPENYKTVIYGRNKTAHCFTTSLTTEKTGKINVYGIYHPACRISYCNYKQIFENLVEQSGKL